MDGSQRLDPSFLVHHFQQDNHELLPTSALLHNGRIVLQSATTLYGWASIKSNNPLTLVFHSNCYILAKDPPDIPWINDHDDLDAPYSPPEWGARVEASEIYRAEDLDEFENNDFSVLFLTSNPSVDSDHVRDSSQNIGIGRAPDRRDESNLPPTKRRRVETKSLFALLPSPHCFTSPNPSIISACFDPRRELLLSASPKPIAPYTPDTMTTYLQDQYARCAWIIPIRGTPPWADCTAAVVLDASSDSSEELPGMLVESSDRSEVIWTKDAVRVLWEWFIELRNAGTMGPIGLSFHPALSNHASPLSFDAKFPALEHQSLCALYPPDAASEHAGSTDRSSLTSMDHIKIYHDASYTVNLRKLLHAWGYSREDHARTVGSEALLTDGRGQAIACEVTSEEKGVSMVTKKIRVLKGAKLVLVDERSNGIMTW